MKYIIQLEFDNEEDYEKYKKEFKRAFENVMEGGKQPLDSITKRKLYPYTIFEKKTLK